MSVTVVLAVDGGNSKTDLALVARRRRACSRSCAGRRARRTTSALDGCIARARRAARRGARAGRAATARVADVGDAAAWPASTSRARRSVSQERGRRARLGGSARPSRNDTFAVLRAGTERGWGVAVVCGAGINCVGVAPDGRHVALPGARRDHRRLGRRLRRRARRALGGGAQRGRPRPEDDARARGAGALRAGHAARARRGDPRSAASPQRRVLELPPVVLRRGASTTRSRPGSSTGSPPRSSRSARVALERLELDGAAGRGAARRRAAPGGRRAPARARSEAGLARGVAVARARPRAADRRRGAARRSTSVGADAGGAGARAARRAASSEVAIDG